MSNPWDSDRIREPERPGDTPADAVQAAFLVDIQVQTQAGLQFDLAELADVLSAYVGRKFEQLEVLNAVLRVDVYPWGARGNVVITAPGGVVPEAKLNNALPPWRLRRRQSGDAAEPGHPESG